MESSPSGPLRRPNLLEVVVAPWIHLPRPTRAALIMTTARPIAFYLMFTLHTVALASGVVVCTMWGSAFEPTQSVTTGPAFWYNAYREQTLAEVWDEWHAHGAFGPAEAIFGVVLLAVALGAHFMSWVNLPRVHRDGRLGRSYWHTFRVLGAGAGITTIAVLGVVFIMATVIRRNYLRVGINDDEWWLMPCVPALWILALFWFGRAVGGAPRLALTNALPPRCEGCGYDLTGCAAEDRCSECGRTAGDSLAPGAIRKLTAWQLRATPASWLGTTLDLLTGPTRFYSTLPLRAGEHSADAFARWHLFAVGVATAIWIGCCYTIDVPYWEWKHLLGISTGLACVTVAIAWLTHRTLSAIAGTALIVTRTLPDYAWLGRAIAYETAFVWVFCGFSGPLVTSFMFGNEWVSDALGDDRHRFMRVFGVDAEAAVLLLGNLLLCGVWMLRYRRIAAAIRWSNV